VQWTAPGRTLCLESATPFIPPRHWRPARGPFGEWLSEEAGRVADSGKPFDSLDGVPEKPERGSRSVRLRTQDGVQ
jgi:hypothetical protein